MMSTSVRLSLFWTEEGVSTSASDLRDKETHAVHSLKWKRHGCRRLGLEVDPGPGGQKPCKETDGIGSWAVGRLPPSGWVGACSSCDQWTAVTVTGSPASAAPGPQSSLFSLWMGRA